MTIFRLALAATCVTALSNALAAQTCMGGATFAHRRAQLNTAITGRRSLQSAVAGASFGETPGPFLSLGIGFANSGNLNDATTVDATGGFGFPVLSTPETEFCPFLSVATFNGQDQTNGVGVSAFSYGLGVNLGTRVTSKPGFELVPFVGGGYFLSSSTNHLGQNEGTIEDNYFNGSLGLGFVFQEVFTIRPSASYLIAHGQRTTTYGLSFSYSFGTVTPRPPRAATEEGSTTTSVWVNPREMRYYCSGSRWYGGTAEGSFMTEREAIAAGYTPERGKRC